MRAHSVVLGRVWTAHLLAALGLGCLASAWAPAALAIDGGTLRVTPRNGWRAFEVVTVGDNPAGDGIAWSIPGTFDGLGAWLPDPATLRVLLNHEDGDATISEVNLNLANFKTAVSNTIASGTPAGQTFVTSAQQAYDRWSSNGGAAWTNTSGISNTSFFRFCSGQSYVADTFGPGRGFADNIYITGEEGATNRLFGIDLANRDFYQLSGAVGSAPGGLGGMPFDPWENAALVDTGETSHVALLLSPDGGSQNMQLYIGRKGYNASGNPAADFLSRNGLAYGSYYYLNDTLPASGTSTDGFFDTTAAGALNSSKLEDVDTSPGNPMRAALADEDSGLFAFNFRLQFSGATLNLAASGFDITKIQNHINDIDGSFGDADNVDWTAPTLLGGTVYSQGLILVNEDSGTGGGETWIMRPDGGGLMLIADTIGVSGASETSGILDISQLLGYFPGSVLLTSNQGSNSSLTVLVNPQAALVPEPASIVLGGMCGAALLLAALRRRLRRFG